MVDCALTDVGNGVVVPRKEEQLASATDFPGDIDGHFLDENRGQDTRPILLFDPNGTLNTLTATQYASRRVVARPGLEHLRRLQVSWQLTYSQLGVPEWNYVAGCLIVEQLVQSIAPGMSRSKREHDTRCLSVFMQEVFCLGIFSSAYQSTLQNVLPTIEAAAGQGQPLFSDKLLILYRCISCATQPLIYWL